MSVILTEVQIPKDTKFGLFSLVHGDRLGSTIGRFAIGYRFSVVSIAVLKKRKLAISIKESYRALNLRAARPII